MYEIVVDQSIPERGIIDMDAKVGVDQLGFLPSLINDKARAPLKVDLSKESQYQAEHSNPH